MHDLLLDETDRRRSRPARGACTAFSTGPLWCADCMSGWLDRLQTAAAAGATAAAVSP